MTVTNPQLKYIFHTAKMEKSLDPYRTYNYYAQDIRRLNLSPQECEAALRKLADILHI